MIQRRHYQGDSLNQLHYTTVFLHHLFHPNLCFDIPQYQLVPLLQHNLLCQPILLIFISPETLISFLEIILTYLYSKLNCFFRILK